LKEASFPWVEVPAGSTTLPPAGTIGVIFNPANLGYGGGNNVGLKVFHRAGVPYVWVLNNDTIMLEGSSADLVAAATADPGIGCWGVHIVEPLETYSGACIALRDFSPHLADGAVAIQASPTSYISGCALFMRTDLAAAAGYIPEDYFMYYEDTAFGYDVRRLGFPPGVVETVTIAHAGSLSSGRRSPLMEYYMRRNRWLFIERYHPEALRSQQWRLFYTFQKYLIRLRMDRIRTELAAWLDYRRRSFGRSSRPFH